MNQQNAFAVDLGTTNWRIYRSIYSKIVGIEGSPQLQLLGEPQLVSLTVFDQSRNCLPAALLIDKDDRLLSYGANAYEGDISSPGSALRDAFKLCIGNNQPVVPSDLFRRYTHSEALACTGRLLLAILERLKTEKPGSLTPEKHFFFTHPVHWGREAENGAIEGEILKDFVRTVRECFPLELRENIRFVTESEAALIGLLQSGQFKAAIGYILIVDIGGGTTDFVAGKWTAEGLQDVRYYGYPHGGNRYDQDLARYLAEILGIKEADRQTAWTLLRYYGRKFKENMSQQILVNEMLPVTLKVMLALPKDSGEDTFLGRSIVLNRQDFEELTRATTADLKQAILQGLIKMNLCKSDVGQVVLVGGGARLYLVPQMLKEIFGNSMPVEYADPPDHAIARGAALWSVYSSCNFLLPPTTGGRETIVIASPIEDLSEKSDLEQIEEQRPVNFSSTEDPHIMSNNQQIRQEMEQVQAELKSALDEMIKAVGNNLKPHEKAEIQKEFEELNTLLERLKTGFVWVALFGKTCVGKSAIANSLIGAEIAEVGVQHDLTVVPAPYKKEPWMIVDVPGIMGTEVNERLAIQEANKAHGHIFVIDGEPYGPELKLFEVVHKALPNTPKIVFVNKLDALEFQHTDEELQIVRQKIQEKMSKFLRSDQDIIYGSARVKKGKVMIRQELPQLAGIAQQPFTALQTALSACHAPGQYSLIFVVTSDGYINRIYFGVRGHSCTNNSYEFVENLRNFLQGNWSGTRLRRCELKESPFYSLHEFDSPVALTGIPSLKQGDQQGYPQTLDRLIRGMRGKNIKF